MRRKVTERQEGINLGHPYPDHSVIILTPPIRLSNAPREEKGHYGRGSRLLLYPRHRICGCGVRIRCSIGQMPLWDEGLQGGAYGKDIH